MSKGAGPDDDMPQSLLRPGENRLRRVLVLVSALVAATVALALVWTHSPLKDFVTRENAAALASAFAGFWWAPIVVFLAYTPASFIMFPRWIITMTAVIAFGPLEGFVLAMSGVILAGIVTFVPGRFVDRETVRPMVEGRLKPAARFVERKGLAAVTLIRLVPIAPFPLHAPRNDRCDGAFGTGRRRAGGSDASEFLADRRGGARARDDRLLRAAIRAPPQRP